MSEDVNTPWANEVTHVSEMGDADFENRSASLSLQDSTGDGPAIVDILSDEWGISQAKAGDRAVRLFLAHLLDTHEDRFSDTREDHEIEFLIPPSGWLGNFEPVNVRYRSQKSTQLTIPIPPTVREVIELVVNIDGIEINSKADFLRKSLYWVIGEFEIALPKENEEDQNYEAHSIDDTRGYLVDTNEKENSQRGLQALYTSEARQKLMNFFISLEWSEESRPFSKQDIINQVGLQRRSVIKHIDPLIELGIVNEVDGYQWTKYEPAVNSEPYQAVLNTNYIIEEYRTK